MFIFIYTMHKAQVGVQIFPQKIFPFQNITILQKKKSKWLLNLLKINMYKQEDDLEVKYQNQLISSIQFQMLKNQGMLFSIYKQNQVKTQKNQQKKESHILSKPMPPEVLQFYRNLKLNRFVVPIETSKQEALRIYSRQYLILFDQNKRLNRQFIELIEQKNKLAEELIEKNKLNEGKSGWIKRRRRYASQIKRTFCCPFVECGRSYGTQGSLTQHVKLKHIQYFKSGEFELYISNILKEQSTQAGSN